MSAQIAKMGAITSLTTTDFSLDNGYGFNIKNDGTEAVELEVQLMGMEANETVTTKFEVGWNPEIVKKVFHAVTLSSVNLKYGY